MFASGRRHRAKERLSRVEMPGNASIGDSEVRPFSHASLIKCGVGAVKLRGEVQMMSNHYFVLAAAAVSARRDRCHQCAHVRWTSASRRLGAGRAGRIATLGPGADMRGTGSRQSIRNRRRTSYHDPNHPQQRHNHVSTSPAHVAGPARNAPNKAATSRHRRLFNGTARR